jgi:hypothetical protein
MLTLTATAREAIYLDRVNTVLTYIEAISGGDVEVMRGLEANESKALNDPKAIMTAAVWLSSDLGAEDIYQLRERWANQDAQNTA